MSPEKLMTHLSGAVPALVTPMTRSGDVDHAALAHNLQWMSRLGLAGYLLLGSTGEQVHLSEFERALVLEIGRRNIPDDQVLIAGTGLAGSRTTIDECKRAGDAGANVALVVTPNYYQKAMTADTLTKHYMMIAEASPIPIMLYSVPSVTGITMPSAVVANLAAHPNVVGMKNSSHHMGIANGYRDAAGDAPFVIMSGSAYASPSALLLGLAKGVILAAGNVLPEVSVALVNDASQAKVADVRRHAKALYDVSQRVGGYGIAGWKAGVEARGHYGGPVRAPLPAIIPSEAKQVATSVQEIFEAWLF